MRVVHKLPAERNVQALRISVGQLISNGFQEENGEINKLYRYYRCVVLVNSVSYMAYNTPSFFYNHLPQSFDFWVAKTLLQQVPVQVAIDSAEFCYRLLTPVAT